MPIDPSTFEPTDSRWGDIFSLLKSKGVNVKSPTTKVGVVNEPVVIVRMSGVMPHTEYSTDDRNVSTSMFDEDFRAHYVTASYTNHRKFNNY